MDSVVGDIFQISAVGSAFNQRILLTHNYRLSAINAGVDDTVTRASLLAAVHDGAGGGDILESTYLAMLPPEYTLIKWRCQLINPVRRAYEDFARGVVGTHLQSALTVNLGCGITLRSEAADKFGHCTKHIGPVPEDVTVMEDGLFTTAYKTIGAAMIGSFVSQAVDVTIGAVWDPIVYNAGEVVPFNKITMGFVGDTVRVQRRRTVGLGE